MRYGTGFVFHDYDSRALLEVLHHLMGAFGHPPAWAKLVQNGMAVDWSWARQAVHYENLYRHMLDR